MCNDKQTIKIVRGTTASFTVTITDVATGNPYVIELGEVIRFGVKATPVDNAYIFTKEITAGSGDYDFTIEPSDTIGLAFGSYWYDIGLQSGTDYYNIIPASPFEITYNVTKWEA